MNININLEPEYLTINGIEYQVSVLTTREVMSLTERGEAGGMDMAKLSIKKDGQSIGDGLDELPFAITKVLLDAMNRVNNLDKSVDDEGNG